MPLLLFSANMNKNGIVTKESKNSVSKTISILSLAAKENGMREFTIIDHQKSAVENGVSEINETKLIIFSQSNVCLELLKNDPAVGLDLPLKVLVYKTDKNKVYIKYRDPKFLKNIYNIGDAEEAIIMSQIIDTFTNFATR